MSWYLNRTGQPEGPFQEQDILQMIQGGLREGSVCPVGGNNWMPLQGHAPFAQALAGGSQSGGYGPLGAGAYGGPPSAGAYGAPPTQAGYGPPPAQSAYGAPPPQPGGYGAPPPQQGGYGAPAQSAYGAPPQGAPPPGAPKKSGGKSMLLLGLLGGVIFLFAAVGIGIYMIAKKPDADLAVSFPRDVTAYMEFPSLSHSLLSSRGIKFLDSDKMDAKNQLDLTIAAFAASFGISKEDATQVVVGMESIAAGGRNFNGPAEPEGVFVLEFRSKSAAETLLASKRFTSTGAFGKGQKAYTLADRGLTYDKRAELPPIERTLSELRADGKRIVLVWMPKPSILVAGSENLVKDMAAVLEDGRDSLDKTETYKKAKKEFEGGSELVAFVDPEVLKNIKGTEAQKIVRGYFHEVGPFVGSLKFVDAGMLVRIDGQLAGDRMPKERSLFADAAKIEVKDRLPAETIGYIAMSTKLGMDGAKAKEILLTQMTEVGDSATKHLREDVARMETETGISVGTALDVLGDDAAVAVVLSKSFKMQASLNPDALLKDGAIVYAQQVKDQTAAKKVVSTLKTKVMEGPLSDSYALAADGEGFIGTPKTTGSFPMPVVHVKFVDKYLLLVVGADAMVKHSISAFETKNETLASDPSHTASIKPLPPNANVYMWIDTGRLTQMALDLNPKASKELESMGIPLSAVRLTGEQRLVSSMSFDLNEKNGLWTYNIDSVNLFAASAGAALSASMKGLGHSSYDPDALSAMDLVGVTACDDYVRRLTKCIAKMPEASRPGMQKGLEQTRKSWKLVAAGPARSTLPNSCAAMVKSLSSNPYCG